MIDRKKVEAFVRPLYQDLDGASRFAEVERVERIARQLHPADDDAFALLLLFHALGKWLDKVGNLSRASLTTGIDETTLRRTAASIRRLAEPQTDAERAVAAAVLIDGAGVRGLADRFSRARREGQSLLDVLRESLADAWIPDWLPENARPLLAARHEARREMCRRILEEL
ncbi:MAG TPA: hypothetical protein VGF69_12900 [Thermoanaerobaculia bacterium]